VFVGCSEGNGGQAQKADVAKEDTDTTVRPGGLHARFSQ